MRRFHGATTESAEVRRAVVRHLVYGAVALVLVSVPTYLALGRIADQHALETAALDGQGIAERLLARAVTPELLAGDPAAIAAMDRRLEARMSDGSLSRVKIWTTDGTIVYSDVHALIGRNFGSDPELISLRDGGPPISAISDLDEEENIYETGQHLVEVYTLETSRAGTDLVYEMYFPLERVQRERDQLLNEMAPVMLALCFLALSQLPLAVGLARSVSRVRHSRQRLLAQTVTAVELERTRLAQELHDDVIQDLSGVAVTLEAIGRSGDAPPGPLDRTAEILRRDVRLLRDIVANLFPVTSHDQGLDTSIRELAAGLIHQGLRVDLELDRDTGVDQVTAGLMYRVAREAMVNISKHAQASTVDVDLLIAPDIVELRVSDDGRGTDPASSARVAGHVGLEIVRATIAEAGGSVVVAPRRPRGTTVTARLPR